MNNLFYYIFCSLVLLLCSCEIPTQYSLRGSSTPKKQVTPIPGREPEFYEILQYVEANQESYLPLFPDFHRDTNRLKLCQVDKWGVDRYYVKDEHGTLYCIGEAYNWKFHYYFPIAPRDSTGLPHGIIRYDRCQLLNL